MYVCECVSCRAHLLIMKSQNSALFAFWPFFSFVRQRKREIERLHTYRVYCLVSISATYLSYGDSHISLERKRIFDFVVIVLGAQDFGGGVKKQSVDAVR